MAQSISQEAIGATGLPGATAASRHAGATASGAPVSGTFAVGDFIVDQSGNEWVCTVAGTPGTWVALRNATQLQGTSVSATAPTTNQVLTYNGTSWAPATAGSALTTVSSWITSDQTIAGTVANITSISLTAGTWLINYQAYTSIQASEPFNLLIGPTSASVTGAYASASTYNVGAAGSLVGMTQGAYILVLASTTTVYLIGQTGIYTSSIYSKNSYSGSTTGNTTGIIAVKVA